MISRFGLVRTFRPSSIAAVAIRHQVTSPSATTAPTQQQMEQPKPRPTTAATAQQFGEMKQPATATSQQSLLFTLIKNLIHKNYSSAWMEEYGSQ